jgi:hypothetical protein
MKASKAASKVTAFGAAVSIVSAPWVADFVTACRRGYDEPGNPGQLSPLQLLA